MGRESRVPGDVPDGFLRRGGARAGAPALGIAVLVVGLAGCGGGGDTRASSTAAQRTTTATTTSVTTTGSTTGTGAGGSRTKPVSAQERVRIAVDAVLTSDNPTDASARYVTQHYLSIAYGSPPGRAQAQAPGSAASSLRPH